MVGVSVRLTAGSSGSHKSRMSSKLLCRLHEDSVLELLLVMAQHTSRVCSMSRSHELKHERGCVMASASKEHADRPRVLQGALQADAPLLLEIFAALFNHCDAEVLRKHEPKAATLPKTSPHEVQRPTPTPNHRARLAPTSTVMQRHPRFGGVFTTRADGARAQCSIGRPISQDPLGPLASLVRASKTVAAFYTPCCLMTSKQRPDDADIRGIHVQEDRQPPRMDSNALLILKGFAEQFLSSSYNLLMGGLRRDLEPGLNISRLSEEDFLRFFKVAGFFTCFVRQQQVRRGCSHAFPILLRDSQEMSTPSMLVLIVRRKRSKRPGRGAA